jgi:hypothetical protein
LNDADTCDRYTLDAETTGDERLVAFSRETQVMQSIAEHAKGLLGILEPRPSFGTSAATGTTASGSTPDMPRTPLGDPSDPEGQAAAGYARGTTSPQHAAWRPPTPRAPR